MLEFTCYVGVHMFVWVESPGENALGLLDPLCMLPEEEQDHSPSLARVFQEAIMDDLQGNRLTIHRTES